MWDSILYYSVYVIWGLLFPIVYKLEDRINEAFAHMQVRRWELEENHRLIMEEWKSKKAELANERRSRKSKTRDR